MGLTELFTDIEIFLVVEPNMASPTAYIHPRKRRANSVRAPCSALSFQQPGKPACSHRPAAPEQDLSVNQTALASNPSSASAVFDLQQATQRH